MDNYTSFRDMIDGGGAGAAGSQFQGGGLLSLLANLFATPLGSEQMTRPQARPPMGLMDTPPVVPSEQPMSLPPPITGPAGGPPPPSPMGDDALMQMIEAALVRSNLSVPPVTTSPIPRGPVGGPVPSDELMRTLEGYLRAGG
jgi:hypothetical protein